MTRFRHRCEQRGCWLERRWDSDNLGRAAERVDGRWPFPRKCSPSDIDGVLDCGGELLFIETKPKGAEIPTGQRLMLESLAHRGATVLLQECDPPSEDRVVRARWLTRGARWQPWQTVDQLGRDRMVQRWFAWAEEQQARVA